MASNSNRFKMSQERLDAIKEELRYLETVREKEVAELIKEARSFGDLSENSEYDDAKTSRLSLRRGSQPSKLSSRPPLSSTRAIPQTRTFTSPQR